MKAKQIIDIIEKYYPLSLQEEWDKCGLQIGNKEQDVRKIMIALNADNDTLNEAIEKGCDMLITHHPFLLEAIVNVDKDDYMGQFFYNAILNNVVVYSSHTTLDRVSMNKWLLEEIGVSDIQSGADGITHYASLNQSMSMQDFINHVRNVYKLEHFKYAGKVDEVKTVAICGGSGADFLADYYNKVDAYITGDTKYRHAKNAVDHHILLIDVNHHIENIMISKLKEVLEKEVNVEIIEGSSPDYYHYL